MLRFIYKFNYGEIKMNNFVVSMIWYWIAYFIVTSIGILHTIFNIVVLHMKSMKNSPGMGEGSEKTIHYTI